jgi:hypothetical protein
VVSRRTHLKFEIDLKFEYSHVCACQRSLCSGAVHAVCSAQLCLQDANGVGAPCKGPAPVASSDWQAAAAAAAALGADSDWQTAAEVATAALGADSGWQPAAAAGGEQQGQGRRRRGNKDVHTLLGKAPRAQYHDHRCTQCGQVKKEQTPDLKHVGKSQWPGKRCPYECITCNKSMSEHPAIASTSSSLCGGVRRVSLCGGSWSVSLWFTVQ